MSLVGILQPSEVDYLNQVELCVQHQQQHQMYCFPAFSESLLP